MTRLSAKNPWLLPGIYSNLTFPVQNSQPKVATPANRNPVVNVGIYHSGLSSPEIQLKIQARRKIAEIPLPCSMGTTKLVRPNMSTSNKIWCSAMVSNYSCL